MSNKIKVALVAVLILGIAGCGWTRTQKGAAIGATAGGAAGAVIGNKAGNTAAGAIIGAAIGGAAGAYIGNYMDKQAEEMERDLEGAEIERIGEGIKITFASGILFDTNKAEVKPAGQTNLTELAQILQKYEDTDILIEGHTDSQGTNEHNLNLSIARAQSAANLLEKQGVAAPRFTIMGYGEDQPVADNETVEGRALNRRVEIAIMANDKLKKVAKEETS